MDAETVRKLSQEANSRYLQEQSQTAEQKRIKTIRDARQWFEENREHLEKQIEMYAKVPFSPRRQICFGFYEQLFAEAVFSLVKEYFTVRGFNVFDNGCAENIVISWDE